MNRSETIQPQGFSILHRDGPCIVVNKPGGLLTQAAPHIDSLSLRIKDYLKRLEQKTGNVYLGMPHRLDRPVSGALVVARHVRAARRLSKQFEERTVGKRYWAWVDGRVVEDTGCWEDSVRKIPDVAQAEVVPPDHPDAKPARLRYRVLARRSDSTLLEIELETGRMHQIRLQAGSRGYPVRGDLQYGSRESFGPETDDGRARWIALHAKSLSFLHPMHRQPVRVQCPLPDWWPADWKAMLEELSED